MKHLCPVLAIIVIAVGCGSAPAGEFHEVITFCEPLGHAWTDELVHYDVRPDAPASPFGAGGARPPRLPRPAPAFQPVRDGPPPPSGPSEAVPPGFPVIAPRPGLARSLRVTEHLTPGDSPGAN